MNDIGVLGRADYKWMHANVARQWTTPASFYRFLWMSAGGQQQFNYDGDSTDVDFHSNISATLKNYWNVGFFNIYHPNYLDERLRAVARQFSDTATTCSVRT